MSQLYCQGRIGKGRRDAILHAIPYTSVIGKYVINKVMLALRSANQAHWRASAVAMLTMAVGFVHFIALLLMLYAWPLGDDYFRYMCISDNSFVDCLRDEWLYRSGRWFSTGLSFAVGTIVGGAGSYRALILINWLIFIGAVTMFFATVFGRGLSLRLKLFLPLSFIALFWSRMPAPGESIYWLNGAFENIGGWSLLLLSVSAIVRSTQEGQKLSSRQIVLIASGSALTFIACGAHEMVCVVAICVFSWWTLMLLWLGRSKCEWAGPAIALVFTAVGLMITLTAPGNWARFGFRDPAINAIKFATLYIVFDVPQILCDMGLIVLVVLLGSVPANRAARPPMARSNQVKSAHDKETPDTQTLAMVALGAVGIVVAVFVFPSYVLGSRMPGRTLNSAHLVTYIATLFVAFVACNVPSIGSTFRRTIGRAAWLWPTTLIFGAVAIFSGINVENGVVDLVQRAPAFDRMMRERTIAFALARKSGALEPVIVAPISPWPHSYYTDDISSRTDGGNNRWIARFYGINAVRRTVIEDR
jgi:Family of unknown function (DUF6056)